MPFHCLTGADRRRLHRGRTRRPASRDLSILGPQRRFTLPAHGTPETNASLLASFIMAHGASHLLACSFSFGD